MNPIFSASPQPISAGSYNTEGAHFQQIVKRKGDSPFSSQLVANWYPMKMHQNLSTPN